MSSESKPNTKTKAGRLRRTRSAVPRFRRAVVLAVPLAAMAVVLGILLPLGSDDPPDRTLDPPAGEALARRACRQVLVVEQQIKDNASADTVMDGLKEAEKTAVAASDKDPIWLPLAGGVSALRIGLRHDRPRDVRLGIDNIHHECDRFKT